MRYLPILLLIACGQQSYSHSHIADNTQPKKSTEISSTQYTAPSRIPPQVVNATTDRYTARSSCTDFSQYPGCLAQGTLILGGQDPGIDNYPIADILSSIHYRHAGTLVPAEIKIIYDYELTQPPQNSLIIASRCSNLAAHDLLGNPNPCDADMPRNLARLHIINGNILAEGYLAQDTALAAQMLTQPETLTGTIIEQVRE